MLMHSFRKNGFSLVELLIAMTLGLILVAGMIAVFSGNKRTSELTSEMANMQESARYALQSISDDLRSAGFQGCLALDHGSARDITAVQALEGTSLFHSAATGSVIVSANDWQPAPVTGFVPPANVQAVPGTHSIQMQGGGKTRLKLQSPMNDGSRPSSAADIVLERNGGIAPFGTGSLAIISDCSSADLFTVSDMNFINNGWVVSHAATHNTVGAFQDAYGNNDRLNQVTVTNFFSNLFFIGTTGAVTENGDLITALYQQSYPFDPILNPPTELMQGIENLRVSFGIQDNTGRVQYVTANDPAYNPAAVSSVQIGLLMSSWDQIASQDDENTYVLAGQAIPASANSVDGTTHAQDRRYRLAFNTTVKVRNRRVQTQ